jgi:hypothetical protein
MSRRKVEHGCASRCEVMRSDATCSRSFKKAQGVRESKRSSCTILPRMLTNGPKRRRSTTAGSVCVMVREPFMRATKYLFETTVSQLSARGFKYDVTGQLAEDARDCRRQPRLNARLPPYTQHISTQCATLTHEGARTDRISPQHVQHEQRQ